MFSLSSVVRCSSLVCVGAALSSCGGDSRSPRTGALAPAAPPAATVVQTSGSASVSGQIPAPKPGTTTVVMLKPVGEREFPAQAAVPVMDQIALAFTPTILFARVGQPAEFHNSDDELHNIRVMESESKDPAFNVALPTGGTYRHSFSAEGFYDVGCDIHPGMSAVIIATSSPFATTASDSGQFAFSSVPAGDYTLSVYSGANRFERTVSVTPGRVELGAVAP